jgi:hypothetical protein
MTEIQTETLSASDAPHARIYELLWKFIWLLSIALPLWLANQVDADTRKAFFEIGPVVVLIPFIPWRYVFQNYVSKPGTAGPIATRHVRTRNRRCSRALHAPSTDNSNY